MVTDVGFTLMVEFSYLSLLNEEWKMVLPLTVNISSILNVVCAIYHKPLNLQTIWWRNVKFKLSNIVCNYMLLFSFSCYLPFSTALPM